jgi:Ser/Thr protein kinase RdoA (MazF antagonist)
MGTTLSESISTMEALLVQILERMYYAGPVQLSLLAHGEKDVFHVQRSPAPDWIVRIYPVTDPAPSRDRVLALAQLLVFLEHHQYPAERVVRTIDGAFTTRIDRWHILVTTYLGPPLQTWQPASTGLADPNLIHAGSSNRDPQLLFIIGALLSRLHALDATGPAGELITAPGLQAASELAWASHCLAQIQDRVPPHLQDEYARLTTRIRQIRRFDECPQTIIHGDAHLGNVVVTPTNAFVLIDWEAAGRGAAVTDLGLLLSSSVDPSDDTLNVAIIHAIIDGYCAHRAITQVERDLLPDALSLRVLVTLAGLFEQRSSPDYQPTRRFWGYTYDQWERHERLATRIARTAQDRLDALAAVEV